MSTSSHISQSRRSTRRPKLVASLPRRAVPYAAEMLERRTLLFAELNLSPQPAFADELPAADESVPDDSVARARDGRLAGSSPTR